MFVFRTADTHQWFFVLFQVYAFISFFFHFHTFHFLRWNLGKWEFQKQSCLFICRENKKEWKCKPFGNLLPSDKVIPLQIFLKDIFIQCCSKRYVIKKKVFLLKTFFFLKRKIHFRASGNAKPIVNLLTTKKLASAECCRALFTFHLLFFFRFFAIASTFYAFE